MIAVMKIECIDGPCDGWAGDVEKRRDALEDRTFLFERRMVDGRRVVDAYAWTGRMSAEGVALLGHVIEVASQAREGKP